MEFLLPLPPSLNATYKSGKHSDKVVFYKSKVARAWEEEAGWEVKRQWNKKTIILNCEVFIDVFYKNEPDIDNYIKITLDLLQRQWVIQNDHLITHLCVTKKENRIQQYLAVSVREC